MTLALQERVPRRVGRNLNQRYDESAARVGRCSPLDVEQASIVKADDHQVTSDSIELWRQRLVRIDVKRVEPNLAINEIAWRKDSVVGIPMHVTLYRGLVAAERGSGVLPDASRFLPRPVR